MYHMASVKANVIMNDRNHVFCSASSSTSNWLTISCWLLRSKSKKEQQQKKMSCSTTISSTRSLHVNKSFHTFWVQCVRVCVFV